MAFSAEITVVTTGSEKIINTLLRIARKIGKDKDGF
jgi:hypothetical protein